MQKFRHREGTEMIPEEVLKELYLSNEFLRMPCVFQAMAISAFEKALRKTGMKIGEDKKNATIHES